MSSPGRDREWMRLNIDYTTDVAMAGLFLSVTPEPLKPCALSRITTAPHLIEELGPWLFVIWHLSRQSAFTDVDAVVITCLQRCNNACREALSL